MNRLETAIHAAEARKSAIFGEPEGIEINFSTEEQSRAVFSGFDIDYDDLRPIAERAGRFHAEMALRVNLSHSHEAAWTEGLLVGLLAASLPHTFDAGATDGTGPEGDDGVTH